MGNNLAMSLLNQIQSKRDEILSIAASHGASDVRVFGSVSRGEEIESSDIDFLVLLQPGRSLLDHAAIKIELEELLGRPVDVATEGGLKAKYRDRILNEAVAI